MQSSRRVSRADPPPCRALLPPAGHACVTATGAKAAAAARTGSGLAGRKHAELPGRLRSCFARPEPWLQAGKYVSALVSGLPRRNGQTIAEHAGDKDAGPDPAAAQPGFLDTLPAMGEVRRFAVAGLEEAARRSGWRRGLVAGALDETGQVQQGTATAGAGRHYLGCAGKVANGITTVHPSYVRKQPSACWRAPAGRSARPGRLQGRAWLGTISPRHWLLIRRLPAALSVSTLWHARATPRPGEGAGHRPVFGPGVPHERAAGHRHLRRCARRRHPVRLHLRERGLRELHESQVRL